MGSNEQLVATRMIAATPAEIFAVLSDPNRHRDTEPGDWVRGAVDPKPILGVGQIFAIDMYLEQIGGAYVMQNLVTEFEQDRTIAWVPGRIEPDGSHAAGGWWWRYDLVAVDEGTTVTLTYNWADTSEETRAGFGGGFPPFPERMLWASLKALEKAVTGA